MPINLDFIRSEFPALQRPAIFLDNPGGTQVCQHSLRRIHNYLVDTYANHGGVFTTSRASDAVVDEARQAMADFLNAARPEEIVFGANMTTLTYNLSRSLARTFKRGDVIVLTRLDHDANISPWLQVAEDRGCIIRWVDFDPEDCTLDLGSLDKALAGKPKLVAFGAASNAVGTVNPVAEITKRAHAAGALVYVDAVQYAPHAPIDVQAWNVDFLACSSYKFFGPHMGILYGRYDLLEGLQAYRVRPGPALPPGKFETGTGNFEGMAGILGALEYFETLAQLYGDEYLELYAKRYNGRCLRFKEAMSAIHAYETELSHKLIDGLQAIPGLRLYGIADERIEQRVPTFSFTLHDFTPLELAKKLAAHEIYVWNGNFYALAVTERLGLEGQGGLLRVGAVHYNTLDEVQRLLDVLSN